MHKESKKSPSTHDIEKQFYFVEKKLVKLVFSYISNEVSAGRFLTGFSIKLSLIIFHYDSYVFSLKEVFIVNRMELLPYNSQFLRSHDLKFFRKRHKKNKRQKSLFLITLPRKICENENTNVRLLKLNGIKFEGI